MKKTRYRVFETNSSSVHTVTVRHDEPYEFRLRRDDSNPGVVLAKCHDYSDKGRSHDYVLSSKQEKLEYLMSWLACKHEYDCDSYSGIYDDWVYKDILAVVQEVEPGIHEIKILGTDKARFDHQTAPYSYNDCCVNLYRSDDIKNFIFNDHVELVCSFD